MSVLNSPAFWQQLLSAIEQMPALPARSTVGTQQSVSACAIEQMTALPTRSTAGTQQSASACAIEQMTALPTRSTAGTQQSVSACAIEQMPTLPTRSTVPSAISFSPSLIAQPSVPTLSDRSDLKHVQMMPVGAWRTSIRVPLRNQSHTTSSSLVRVPTTPTSFRTLSGIRMDPQRFQRFDRPFPLPPSPWTDRVFLSTDGTPNVPEIPTLERASRAPSSAAMATATGHLRRPRLVFMGFMPMTDSDRKDRATDPFVEIRARLTRDGIPSAVIDGFILHLRFRAAMMFMSWMDRFHRHHHRHHYHGPHDGYNHNMEDENDDQEDSGEEDEENSAWARFLREAMDPSRADSHPRPTSKSILSSLSCEPIAASVAAGGPICDATCVICMESMRVGERASTLPCKHRFHYDCLLPWLKKDYRCPMCRFALPTDDPEFDERIQREQQQKLKSASSQSLH